MSNTKPTDGEVVAKSLVAIVVFTSRCFAHGIHNCWYTRLYSHFPGIKSVSIVQRRALCDRKQEIRVCHFADWSWQVIDLFNYFPIFATNCRREAMDTQETPYLWLYAPWNQWSNSTHTWVDNTWFQNNKLFTGRVAPVFMLSNKSKQEEGLSFRFLKSRSISGEESAPCGFFFPYVKSLQSKSARGREGGGGGKGGPS